MVGSGLFTRIYTDIAHNRVALPSMPSIALRLRKVMANPKHDIDSVAKVIATDPGASGYLIQMANGPLYLTRIPAQDIKSAVRRLGISVTRNLIMAYAMRRLFLEEGGAVGKKMKAIWRVGARTGAIAGVIARRLDRSDSDRALLAGLIQDIGALPLLMQLAGNMPKVLDQGITIEQSLNAYAGKVGVVLLRKWELEEEFVEVARCRKEWGREGSGSLDLADLVLIARLLNYMGRGMHRLLPKLSEIPALAQYPGGLSAKESFSILTEAKEEIRAVEKLIGS